MIRMFARRMNEISVAAGSDQIVLGMSLPSGSVIHDINLEVHLHNSVNLSIDNIAMYAIEGWILPVLDPDAGTAFSVLWDNLVPKDTDVEVIDLDTAGADVTPFFEPGEVDFSQMLEVGLRPERIYARSQMLSIVNGSIFKFQDNQTPFAVQWIAGDTVKIRIRKRFHVNQPSVLLFGVASPTMDDTTATPPVAAAEAEWGQLKYIGHVLERALLHLFGVVETGAETPWEEATALLKAHLEPDVFEETGGFFGGVTWETVCRGIVDHSVEGELGKQAITTGR